ncbi:MBOAT family O-acyltransferase [Schlesneria paludicola]|uniref:MBOAT family O-acyltransferase n=1 Tax=Schlesneria paludicola TaxID=360056 RepID=UPI0002F5C79B|nr:MBOAT family O-acyltransferase [Schlesneria paludicola]
MATETLLALGLYLLLGRWLVGLTSSLRDPAFAALNIGAVYYFFYWNNEQRFPVKFQLVLNLIFVAYLFALYVQYLAMRRWSDQPGWQPWIAFFIPILFLIVIRYAPVKELAALVSPSLGRLIERRPDFTLNAVMVGFSYIAFRSSYLVLEVRNGVVPKPGLWQYFGFAIFLPTLSVGPISPYRMHHQGFVPSNKPEIPVGRAALRVLVGAVKNRFFGPLLNQLTYTGLLLDEHPHHLIDLPIAAVAYYLYLYCNFSGFCDIAIGSAGLMGIPVAENFANPLVARNLGDYWNRWHITLSHYMRDVVFSPLSKFLVRTFGPKNANHAIALTILVVFLLVGIWHGVGWNYAAFGVAHAAGLIAHHYYTIYLKKWLGRERFAAYNRNRAIHAVSVALTFSYVSACLFLFANDGESMARIFSMLRL